MARSAMQSASVISPASYFARISGNANPTVNTGSPIDSNNAMHSDAILDDSR